MPIGLDATYAVGRELSGVGVYSREILQGLARAHREERFDWWYRPHRFLRGFKESSPPNCKSRILFEPIFVPRNARLFHGLNQRLPTGKLRRSVSTFHDLFVMTSEYSTPEFRKRFTELAKDAAARSDLIIAVSQFTADQVSALLRVEPSRIRVVHHGVRIPPGRHETRRENVVLHVGAIQQRKNISRLIGAFEQCPDDWRLVLAGSRGFGADAILEQIQSSRVKQRIELTGFISDQTLSSWYSRASVMAFPSLDEGFGMPVLDAMAAGLPVICSNGSALREVAGEAALLIDPRSVDELAEGMKRLMVSGNLREDLAKRGRGRAGQFSWDRAVNQTWEIYQELF